LHILHRQQKQRDIDDGSYVPDADMDDFSRWFKTTFVGDKYDSRKKKQARYVIKNIAFISIGIGVIFTATWYWSIAQGIPFISRANNFDTAKGRYETITPQGLMDDEFEAISKNSMLDRGPNEIAPQTRFAVPAGKPLISVPQAPKPSIEL
jgi:hypothetical protein